MRLEGSCRCGAISFSVDSHTPYPYQRCYCSICRKSAGGGGYAINIMGLADTLKVKGKSTLGVWNAPIDGRIGSADRIDLADVAAGTLINDEVAQMIASRHAGLNAGALVGLAFDSLFKQLCGEQALFTPTGGTGACTVCFRVESGGSASGA
jgi:hypothetical protein